MDLFMIEGIGVDIIEVKKIRAAARKWGGGFLRKVFTENEEKYCRSKRFPFLHFAGRFAAKEAIAKAMGTGFWRKGLTWTDFEIVNNGGGMAEVRVGERQRRRLRGKKIMVSISHCRDYAVANAIICRAR